ncbi:uncharacterized protein LOC117109606 [Anneissia japonica]|uniref:uncharacterized protein LOC117109606 n=1 Tax=Anneissia japonica TaxID=1529436 RepID=UPI0014256F2B|nr:uncharacterized protein LOC117109606 [Anneissia japonica]
MALSKEVTDENFGSLKLEVSKWFDKRRYGVSMLKVLYRDRVKNTSELYGCSKTMDIIELLIGAGHLTPTNLTILYETIKLTQQFGLGQLIKDRHPSFQIPEDIRNIAIDNFTLHRQRLVNLGMALSFSEIQHISGLYSVAEEHAADSWSLIMDLEQRMKISEGEMESFIENMRKINFPKAVKALTEVADTTPIMDKERTHSPTGSIDTVTSDHDTLKESLKKFKNTFKALEKDANQCKKKLQYDVWAANQEAAKLEQHKDMSLRNIDNHMQEIVKKVKENGKKLKNEVGAMYEKNKNVLDIKIIELNTIISDIDTKLSFLNQLLKDGKETAMQSSETAITSLKERINDLPKSLPNDGRQIHFFINKQQMTFLQQCDIGNIKYLRTADCLQLQGVESVIQDQTIVVRVIKTEECEIHSNQLKATWTHPTGETNITQVEEDDNGDYILTKQCTTPGVWRLNVCADGEPIKQSPLMFNVETKESANAYKACKKYHVKDVVKYEDDCFLVSCETNEILKYKQSGEYISKVTLPLSVKVNKMFKMKNSNIAFSDLGNKCIKICNMEGHVIQSIGQGELREPSVIHVDEASSIMYVGDSITGCLGEATGYVLMFNIVNDNMIRKFNGGKINEILDISLTSQGHIFLKVEINVGNDELKVLNTDGTSVKCLKRGSQLKHKVKVDEHYKIIHKYLPMADIPVLFDRIKCSSS